MKIEAKNMGEVAEAFRVIREIPIRDLYPSDTNPRRNFNKEELDDLKDSIAVMGVRQCLIVRQIADIGGGFEIVAGERRYRAAGMLGLENLPCEVREMTNREVVTFQLVENIQRSDLSPIEELAGCESLISMGLEEESLPGFLGKSAAWVQTRMNLVDLPSEAKAAVDCGLVDMQGAVEILKVAPGERAAFTQEILGLGEMPTADQLGRIVAERYLVPAENRKRWEFWKSQQDFSEGLEPLGDCEKWAEYVRPYGEGVGVWKPEDEAVGGLAAREEEALVNWGQLAEVHGVGVLVVPIGGVRSGEIRTARLVDRTKVEAAERGARQNGDEFTLGPRACREVKEERGEDGGKAKAAGIVDFEEVADSYQPVPVSRVSRLSRWNPWLIDAVEVEAEHLIRGVIVRDVLDQECPGWGDRFAEVVGEPVTAFERPETFWALRRPRLDDKRTRKIAGLLGVLEVLAERLEG